MNIETANVENRDGVPVLVMTIDGRQAEVIDPKPWLLDRGIVVLLDDEGYWAERLSLSLPIDRATNQVLAGATRDAGVVALARRFIAGEMRT